MTEESNEMVDENGKTITPAEAKETITEDVEAKSPSPPPSPIDPDSRRGLALKMNMKSSVLVSERLQDMINTHDPMKEWTKPERSIETVRTEIANATKSVSNTESSNLKLVKEAQPALQIRHLQYAQMKERLMDEIKAQDPDKTDISFFPFSRIRLRNLAMTAVEDTIRQSGIEDPFSPHKATTQPTSGTTAGNTTTAKRIPKPVEEVDPFLTSVDLSAEALTALGKYDNHHHYHHYNNYIYTHHYHYYHNHYHHHQYHYQYHHRKSSRTALFRNRVKITTKFTFKRITCHRKKRYFRGIRRLRRNGVVFRCTVIIYIV